jgi:hypothetical protein
MGKRRTKEERRIGLEEKKKRKGFNVREHLYKLGHEFDQQTKGC